ncbi:hypothetical protein JTB14_004243 [Gonioctena quinquepunctata]|nr:hypothetical protein JTB14_004243 [Gonioctena quinquepunctata]
MNPELKSIVYASHTNRDATHSEYQKYVGKGLIALGTATKVCVDNVDKKMTLMSLADAGITKNLKSLEKNLLFLVTRKPHSIANKHTTSKWVEKRLAAAGIDTYSKPHSTIHAPTSAALRGGISLEDVCRTVGSHWNVVLNNLVGNLVRCIDDGMKNFILEPLQDDNDGVVCGTPHVHTDLRMTS